MYQHVAAGHDRPHGSYVTPTRHEGQRKRPKTEVSIDNVHFKDDSILSTCQT